MQKLRSQRNLRVITLTLLVSVISWVLPPAVRASMTLANLSPDWILSQLAIDDLAGSAQIEPSELVVRLAEPLRQQAPAQGAVESDDAADKTQADLLNQVLLDGMTSMLSLSGITAHRALAPIDRQAPHRGCLLDRIADGWHATSVALTPALRYVPLSNARLIHILSDSAPLGP